MIRRPPRVKRTYTLLPYTTRFRSMETPEATPDALMASGKGPDCPTGALIMGRSGIMDAYRTGKGSIRLRARAEIVEGTGRQRDRIVVTEMPYQTSIAARS